LKVESDTAVENPYMIESGQQSLPQLRSVASLSPVKSGISQHILKKARLSTQIEANREMLAAFDKRRNASNQRLKGILTNPNVSQMLPSVEKEDESEYVKISQHYRTDN